MATISHLYTSISQMEPEALTSLFLRIRENRRRRPPVKVRKAKSNARSTRRVRSKKNPSQQDIFSMITSMSLEEKTKIAKLLLNSKET